MQSAHAHRRFPILIVTENLNVGGAEKYTVLLANELQARGHRVVVFANHGPFREHFDPGIRFVRAFFERGILGVLWGTFQIVRICVQEGIEIIHAQKLESSRAAYIARFLTGVPIVKTAHGYTPKELETLGAKIDRYSDRVITVVDWLKPELAKNGVQSEKLSVIHNGMGPIAEPLSARERAALRESLDIKKDDPVIVSVARLERGKNYASLIRWFPQVLARVPEAKLLIVGTGPERNKLIALTAAAGIGASVRFVEATTRAERYLHIADIFCTPTVARGMAVLEAMAAGLPVVGTQPKGPPIVVEDGVTGFVVDTIDGNTFADRIIDIITDLDLAKRMGAAGKRRAARFFSLAAMVDEVELVYAATRREAREQSAGALAVARSLS